MSLKDMLKGVCGKDVDLFEVDKFLNKEGVLVDIHSSRQTGRATLNPKLYGVDIDANASLSDFRKEYIKGEKISFLPLSMEKKFVSIESSIRMKRSDLSIALEGKFMTVEAFKEFHEFFKTQQEEFNNHKEYILSNWDKYMKDFKEQLDYMLNELNSLDKSTIYYKVLEKMPSKDAFRDTCGIDIDLMAFPTTQSFNIIDEDISDEMRSSLKKRSLSTVNEILGNTLNYAFVSINEVMFAYDKNGVFATTSINKLSNLASKISKKNILKHPLINDLIKKLSGVKNIGDTDEILETLEECCINIFAFSTDIGIKSYLNMSKSFLEEKVLEQLSTGITF